MNSLGRCRLESVYAGSQPVPLVPRMVLSAFLALSGYVSQAQSVPVPAAHANDNRVAAGELKQNVLNLRLELVNANWFPELDGGSFLPVYAFAEPGRAPQIPGPLIRVPQGTEVRVSLHNTLPVTMFVRGLHSHAKAAEPLHLATGETADVRFTASSPGSYYYSARSTKDSIGEVGSLPTTEDLPMGEGPFGIEGQLNGGFIVDPPGSAGDDRIFVITLWMRGVITPPFREIAAINGKSWPYTERLFHRVGDTVRWRVLNPSLSDHAMHLHGFFFRVDSLGDGDQDKSYSPDEAPHAVTQHLPPGGTMSLTWTSDRVGQWLFHCHMFSHMAEPSVASQLLETDSHPSAHADSDDPSGMRGLILGVTVTGDRAAPTTASDRKPRQLRLLVREKPATRFSLARMGYLIQEGAGTETSDPPSIPGAPLILTRGEPVEITVVNQLKEETSVHWHGIELESYYDGVPGWSGASPQTTPPIPPGGRFLARMTPPRAGTFIYHTHWHDVAQLTSGLYGPLLVLEPGEKYDPQVDKIFLISRAGPDESNLPVLLNGTPQPGPLVLKSGTKYRFRFINIGTDDSDTVVALLNGVKPVQWREVAKDGWTLPDAQSALQPARQGVTVGETHDFEFVPEHAGDELALEITSPFLRTKITQTIAVH